MTKSRITGKQSRRCSRSKELQKAYGSEALSKDGRSVEFPKYKWIKEAIEKLVEFKMAIPPTDDSDVYQILFKAPRQDILKRFIELTLPKEKAKADSSGGKGRQLPLFEEDGAGG